MPAGKYSLLLTFVILLCAPCGGASGDAPENSEIAPLASRSLLLDITRAGNRLVAVGERGHVLYSDNGGVNWQQVIVPARSLLTCVYFVDEKNGWAAGHDGVILHTQDAGISWSLQHYDQQFDDPVLDIWFRNSDEGFAVGAYGMFLSTSNGGRSWEQRDIIDDDFHLNAITALPDGALFIVAEQGHIYHSVDSGYTWKELPSPYPGSFFGVTPLGADTLIVYGLRGHLYRSSDRGRTWQQLNTETEASLMAAMRANNNRVYVVGLGGTLLESTGTGSDFSSHTRNDRKTLTGLVQADTNLIVLTGAGGISFYREDSR